MDCHKRDELELKDEADFKILMMGNPNVGKSVIFSKLTGREVLAANYSGTTVSFTRGKVEYGKREGILVDVPGVYSLEACSPAEAVALELLNQGADALICVLDATNLERSLNFALQLMEGDMPLVLALNLVDVAQGYGIDIDVKALEAELGVPVVPTVAVRNVGLEELLARTWQVIEGGGYQEKRYYHGLADDERWQQVERIISLVQRVKHRHPTIWEKLGHETLRPFPGIPIALLVLAVAMGVVVGGGKALRALILLPLINGIIVPFLETQVARLVPQGILLNVLVGEYGVLVKGIEWPFALILPYVFLFYVVISILEDSGYLPRLGVLVDGILRRVGIQGGNIVPFVMGYGCAVPAILGTRAAATNKERLMITALVAFAVPCAAQTGAFVSLLGDRSVLVLVLVYLISFAAIVGAGAILDRFLPGKNPPLLLEIPNLLKPDREALAKKIWVRTRHFMLEAEIPMLLGIGVAALVAETGLLNYVGRYIEPLVEGWLGLPREASLALLLGVVRRELAVLPLLELELSTLQLLVGSVVALFYLPCLSVLGVLVKEFSLKVGLSIALATFVLAFFLGGLLNQAVQFFQFLFL